jgi:biotin transport system substrate-specific component
MNTLSLPSRSTKVTVVGIVGFAAALAAAAQVAIPLPGTPVPATLTPFVVVLAGLWLGPRAGALSMLLYLAAGAVGLPVFAPMGAPGIARFFGPTGGYLFAYPAAAFVTGLIAERKGGTFLWRWIAGVAGMAVIFTGGIAQLALLNDSLARAVTLGITPFAALDVVKALVAALVSGRRATRA